MLKIIKIGSKDFTIKSSAYTMFAYKNDTGRDLLKDIGDINKKYKSISKLSKEDQEEKWMEEITGIVENALKLAYTMIKEADKNFGAYDEWLKGLDNLFEDSNWILEVIEAGMTPFSGGVQNPQNKK